MALDIEAIEREIDRLETKETSHYVCSRLAYLYTVRDHMAPKTEEGKTQWMSGSEFLEASSGVSYRRLMSILDEHMSALSVVQPAQYESIMAKIRALGGK